MKNEEENFIINHIKICEYLFEESDYWGAYIGATPIKEIYLWTTKVRPEGTPINLNLENWQPIWRLHDWELWFRVNVKDASEPFKIAMSWYNGTSYDLDISVDWNAPVRYSYKRKSPPIEIPMTAGNHYVKITPHNWITAGWAKVIGNSNYANWWNNDPDKLEFWLEWLPWYAFMKSETEVGDNFLEQAWIGAKSLVSMPNIFSLPSNISTVGHSFLACTRDSCISLKSMPDTFNLPQQITSVWNEFVAYTWNDCTSLESISSWFYIPQGITNAGDNFFTNTWNNCTSLTSSGLIKPLKFPYLKNTPEYYADDCFLGTCPITPDTPSPWRSVIIRRE